MTNIECQDIYGNYDNFGSGFISHEDVEKIENGESGQYCIVCVGTINAGSNMLTGKIYSIAEVQKK